MKSASRKFVHATVALAAGLLAAAALRAADPAPAEPGPGLLGTNYFGFSYAHYQYSDSPVNADGFGVEWNHTVRPNLDFGVHGDWLRTGEFEGVRARMVTLLASVRAFASGSSYYRPYFEVAGGWASAEAGGVAEVHSSVYRLGAGVEFAPTSTLTLTPFGYYQDYSNLSGARSFTYGLKANLWFTPRCAFTATATRNDSSDLTYSVGMNFRF